MMTRVGEVVQDDTAWLEDLNAASGSFPPLGQDGIDRTDVSAVREVGDDGRLIVERDSHDGDPGEAARISRTFLDEAGVGR